MSNPERRFSYVEMKFFYMWWTEQSLQTKIDVKQLIKEGRLEIINGGWSMNDEACPTYQDIINNMKMGHDFLLNEFNVIPRIGWQIDPFGHSNANARLFAEMGLDAVFFSRVDYQDKQVRLDNQSLEFIWRPMFSSLGNYSQIFTHVLYDHYSSPQGLCFDFLCNGNNPFIDDPSLDNFNAPDMDWLMY
jgi:hypothetical protein